MTISNQILAAFPKNINRSGQVFAAVVANGKDAAIETVLQDARGYINEYISTPDVYEQQGTQLEKTINYFSFLERFDNESEKSLKQRFGAIYRRSGDVVWGNPHNVRNVFREYFPTATIYLLEGTNDITENLLQDGDFEDDVPAWQFTAGASRVKTESFSKTWCAELAGGGHCRQVVEVQGNKAYSIHWFQRGQAGLSVKDQAGRYWNGTEWQAEEFIHEFANADWNNNLFFLRTDETVTEITISYHGIKDTSYVDYVQLYEKHPFHSFTIIAHFVSGAVSGDLALAPGQVDDEPIEQDKYDEYDYYGNAYITGVKTGYALDLYRDLLEYTKSCGVKAYLNICNQDYKQEESK